MNRIAKVLVALLTATIFLTGCEETGSEKKDRLTKIDGQMLEIKSELSLKGVNLVNYQVIDPDYKVVGDMSKEEVDEILTLLNEFIRLGGEVAELDNDDKFTVTNMVQVNNMVEDAEGYAFALTVYRNTVARSKSEIDAEKSVDRTRVSIMVDLYLSEIDQIVTSLRVDYIDLTRYSTSGRRELQVENMSYSKRVQLRDKLDTVIDKINTVDSALYAYGDLEYLLNSSTYGGVRDVIKTNAQSYINTMDVNGLASTAY